jgi:hypothetical protein
MSFTARGVLQNSSCQYAYPVDIVIEALYRLIITQLLSKSKKLNSSYALNTAEAVFAFIPFSESSRLVLN